MSPTISVQQLAQQLGVSPSVVYRAIERNEIRGVRLGRRVLVPANEAQRVLEAPVATNGSAAHEAPSGSATDRLIQAITLQVSTMNGLKADLKNVGELLAVLVKELTS